MKNLKHIVFNSILFLVFSNLIAQSEISILVQTNVNSFKCEVKGNAIKQMPSLGDATKIAVAVDAFTCPKKMMTEDLKEIFEADKYPHIFLFIEDNSIARKNLKTEIKIKNTTQTYQVPVNHQNNKLIGSQTVSLKDFKITPPVKALGMVKVKDNVSIQFTFPKDFLVKK